MSVMNYLASLDPLRLIRNLPGGIAQGILWGIMALGVYITFRLLRISDLTVEGSFATGGAVTVTLITKGMSPFLATLLSSIGFQVSEGNSYPAWFALSVSTLAGIICGLFTGALHSYLGIPAILAGILTQLALYSVNLRIMGMAANTPISVDNYDLTVSGRYVVPAILIGLVISAVIIAVMYWYFGTEQGSAIRATGNNPVMSRAQGIDIDHMKMLGFALSNGIVAFAGGLVAQYQGFADVNMGRGASVIGLAAVIIGDAITDIFAKRRPNFAVRMSCVILGGVIYYCVVVLVLWLRLNTNDLKLFTALIVAVFLAIPYLKEQRTSSFARFRKGGQKNA